MGMFTAFATGALGRREEVRDERYDAMQERMKEFRATLTRGAPAIAELKQKNAAWNEAYKLATRLGATDGQARQYAMNPTNETWAALSSAVNSTKYRQALNTQSNTAATTSASPQPAPSADNGYGTEPYSEQPMEEITVTAQRPAPVPAPPAQPAFGPTTQSGGAMQGMTSPNSFERKTSFLQNLLGIRSIDQENAQIFRELGNETGTDPRAVQQQYNQVISGDFGFVPPETPDDGLGIPTGTRDPLEVEEMVATRIASLNFSSTENMQAFRNAFVQAAMNNDPKAMEDAYKYAMDDAAKAALTVRTTQKGQATANQVWNHAEEATSKVLGGVWNRDPMTGRTTMDFGALGEDGAILSQLATAVQGDVHAQLTQEDMADPASVPPELFDKYAALYAVVRIRQRIGMTPEDQRATLKTITLKGEQIAKQWGISAEEYAEAVANMKRARRM